MSKKQITTHFDAYGHEQTAVRNRGRFDDKPARPAALASLEGMPGQVEVVSAPEREAPFIERSALAFGPEYLAEDSSSIRRTWATGDPDLPYMTATVQHAITYTVDGQYATEDEFREAEDEIAEARSEAKERNEDPDEAESRCRLPEYEVSTYVGYAFHRDPEHIDGAETQQEPNGEYRYFARTRLDEAKDHRDLEQSSWDWERNIDHEQVIRDRLEKQG